MSVWEGTWAQRRYRGGWKKYVIYELCVYALAAHFPPWSVFSSWRDPAREAVSISYSFDNLCSGDAGGRKRRLARFYAKHLHTRRKSRKRKRNLMHPKSTSLLLGFCLPSFPRGETSTRFGAFSSYLGPTRRLVYKSFVGLASFWKRRAIECFCGGLEAFSLRRGCKNLQPPVLGPN
jgi:hypothetical protein